MIADVVGVLGLVGSPIDVATFVGLIVMYARQSARVDTTAAGLVALAEQERHVDDDRLQDELDVDDREVAAIRPTIVDGGDRR
jgi:sugar diacid utilization regulator